MFMCNESYTAQETVKAELLAAIEQEQETNVRHKIADTAGELGAEVLEKGNRALCCASCAHSK